MRLRAPFVAGLLVLALGAPAAQAAPRSWYAYYLDARDKDIPAKRWKKALEELEHAVKLKPDSALTEQTYGLNFEDYLPYFYEGKCHLALGDYNSAMLRFNIEEKAGKIQQRAELWKELRRLRAEADANQRGVDTAEKVRTLTQDVVKLRQRATELHKAGNYDEALKLLAQAEGTAKVLDAGTQAEIAAATQKIRDDGRDPGLDDEGEPGIELP
jgi:tetratricopeptide (TPR) repeat protein